MLILLRASSCRENDSLTLSLRTTGMIRWLSTMVDVATDSAMTIPAAAEKPPRKASSASHG